MDFKRLRSGLAKVSNEFCNFCILQATFVDFTLKKLLCVNTQLEQTSFIEKNVARVSESLKGVVAEDFFWRLRPSDPLIFRKLVKKPGWIRPPPWRNRYTTAKS